jgi:hypothetical protein
VQPTLPDNSPEILLHLRRTLFTNSVAEAEDFHEQLASGAKLMNTIRGLYDHGTRVLACVEQTAELDESGEAQSAKRQQK